MIHYTNHYTFSMASDRSLRSSDEIKRRVTGDIRELNRRLLPLGKNLIGLSRKRKWATVAPGIILRAFYRKGVNTFASIELLKRSRLIEESWILLRVRLESHINFFYFLKNDPAEMTQRYSDGIMIDKLKFLHSVSFFDGEAPWASTFSPGEWRDFENEIKGRYTTAEYNAVKRNGFTGLSAENRAKDVGLVSMYDKCYRIASRNIHLFDPADTPLYRRYVPQDELTGPFHRSARRT